MAPPNGTPVTQHDAESARDTLVRVRDEIAKVVVGQDGVVTGLITALLVRGHVLLEGVPGVAKTLLVTTLGPALDLAPPAGAVHPRPHAVRRHGQRILEADGAGFRFREGPVFTNLLLADEINRTPPRTQAALLEAMQERQVSVDGRGRPLPDPFLVVATQNPVEYEGPTRCRRRSSTGSCSSSWCRTRTWSRSASIVEAAPPGARAGRPRSAAGSPPVAGAAELAAARAAVRRGPRRAAGAGLPRRPGAGDPQAPAVELGVSPRGATMLLHAAKAWAWLAGRSFVSPDEVKAVAKPTLRHRLQLRPEVELEGGSPDARPRRHPRLGPGAR
jgi:MoxR-like ATPase